MGKWSTVPSKRSRLHSASKGGGHSQNEPGKDKWIFKHWGEIDRKWKKLKLYLRSLLLKLEEKMFAVSFLRAEVARLTALSAGPVPPNTTLHQPCQDCKELHVPPVKCLHQLAFTARETISKLIIWIFFPSLFYFQSCFALISSLNTFTCSPSLLPWFSRQVCKNRAFQKSQPTKVRV